MEEGVGFEPTDGFPSSVFKTDAISQTRPTLQMVGTQGIEPQTKDFQSSALPTELRPHGGRSRI